MIVVAGFAFADSKTLNVTAAVAQRDPNYIISGRSTETGDYGAASATVDTGIDLSANDAVAYIIIEQDNNSKYKTPVVLTVVATPMVNQDLNFSTSETDTPTVANLTPGAVAANIATNNYSVAASGTGTVEGKNRKIVITVTYNGKPVNGQGAGNAKTIATWKYTWGIADENTKANLPVGTYQSTITLTYTVS